MKNLQVNMDKTAIGISVLCSVHCLLMPVLITTVPAITSFHLEDELFHKALIFLVIPVSIFALTMGCKNHHKKNVLVFGICGLLILTFTALFGHDLLGELGEKIATLIGSAVTATGHILNYRACGEEQCHE